MVDPYLFPARGRKLVYLTKIEFVKTNVDPYLFPARGRKHMAMTAMLRSTYMLLIPTFSPQGDGNLLASHLPNHQLG